VTDAPNRFVLLGASNLTRALATVVAIARSASAGPGRFLIACGHGRSYGMQSRVLIRTLPGIVQCGLWPALADVTSARTYALITDLGNDIAYGAEPEDIVQWLRFCVARLQASEARIIVTLLPIERLERLTAIQFRLVKAALFPSRPIQLAETLARARALNRALHALAREHGLVLVEQPPTWYGADPIHIRRRLIPEAYATILRHWQDADFNASQIPKVPLRDWLRFQRYRPLHQRVLGIDWHSPQPAGRLPDASTVSLY
jgi:hypothetical protein